MNSISTIQIYPQVEEESRLIHIDSTWQSLIRSMEMFGINLKRKWTIRGIIMIIGTCLYSTYRYSVEVYKLYTNISFIDFIKSCFFVMYTITPLLSLQHFYNKRKYLLHHLSKLFENAIDLKITSGVNKNTLLVKVVLIWFCSGFNILFHLVIILMGRGEEIPDSWVKAHNFRTTSLDHTSYTIYFISVVCYHTLLKVTQGLFFLLFVVICVEIENAFKCLYTLMKKCCDSSEDMKKIAITYMKFLDTSVSIQDIYSRILFVWAIYSGGSISFSISLFTNPSYSHPLEMTVEFITIALYPFCLFADACLSASRITEIAKQFSLQLYKFSLLSKNKNSSKIAYRFSVKCMQELPRFSAWGIISVDCKLPLTMVSVALTYTIIVYQFEL